MNAIISADVVSSTSLALESLIRLQDSIKSCIRQIEDMCPNSWGRLVKGDSIEIFLDDPKDAVRVALLLKTAIKSCFMHDSPASIRAFRRSAVRMAIGLGDMRINDRYHDIMDGEAIYLAGRGLSSISETDSFVIKGELMESNPEISLMASMANIIISKSGPRSCHVLNMRLLGYNQKRIAETLGISPSRVSQSLKLTGWESLEGFVHYYESIIESNK